MHQHLVAKQVAIFVIHFLEFIQVEHGQTLARRRAGSALKVTRILTEEMRHPGIQCLAI